MAALAATQKLVENTGDTGSFPVLNAVKIYKGGLVGITAAGYAKPFATGLFFAGHAQETVDNTDGSAGAVRVNVKRGSYVLTVPTFDSATIAHVGDNVGCSSDNHADLTRTNTDRVGIIEDVNANGVAVRFETFGVAGISKAVQDALDLKANV